LAGAFAGAELVLEDFELLPHPATRPSAATVVSRVSERRVGREAEVFMG
jgi:hypothetical protein